MAKAPKPLNERYKHYKGDEYIVLYYGHDMNGHDEREVVVYTDITSENVYVRSKKNFFKKLEGGRPRFERIDE